MPTNQVTMKFWRDAYKDAACLEYSWAPQGLRHTIMLQPGEREGSSTNPMPGNVGEQNSQADDAVHFIGDAAQR